jgi:D-3-phosphoglycerate dehydrogenase
MQQSDAVILHLPLVKETYHLIDAAVLQAAKPGAFLINVSRGGVVDTQALVQALSEGRLCGAGLDVLEGEPNPLKSVTAREDVILTPHVAFSSDAAIQELRRTAMGCALAVLAGQIPPPNACNAPR